MGERLGARPVRVVLMPGDNASVVWRLDEELVVPEAYRAAKQLRGGHEKRGIPEQVMECFADTPCSESVKEDAVGIGGFVGVVFVEEVARCSGIHQVNEIVTERFDLIVIEHPHAGEVAIPAEEGYLFLGEAVPLPLRGRLRPRK